jgi:hypothetical protein
MPRLSSDTRAVLRELRRTHREIERQLTRIANALVLTLYAVQDSVANATMRQALAGKIVEAKLDEA